MAFYGITTMEAANRVALPSFNAGFMQPASEAGTAFIPWIGSNLDDILREQYDRTVTDDNGVSFEGKQLQIPVNRYRCHYVRVRVRVHRYRDGSLAVFHGPVKLADYDAQGRLKKLKKKKDSVNLAIITSAASLNNESPRPYRRGIF
jgi:hypothetical protein